MAPARHACAKIPPEARRKLREFKREIAEPAESIFRALADVTTVKKLVSDYVHKKGTGRARVLMRLKKKFAGAEFVTAGDCFEFWWLEPHGPLIVDARDEGEKQDCILAHFAVAGPSSNHSSMLLHAWSIEAPDHALARLLQRSPTADLKKILLAARLAFMHASSAEVLNYIKDDRTFYLSAGDGLLVCVGINGQMGGQRFTYARARTWISNEMAGVDQKPIEAADDEAETMGDLVLAMARGDC